MKSLIFFTTILILLFKLNLSEVRLLYKEADSSKENTMILHKKLEPVSKNDNKVLVAYKGAVLAMTAKYEKGSKHRMEVFKNGISFVEYAIEVEPQDLEIRFVRLSLQQNSPKFLKYNKHLDEDKKFVLSNYNHIQSSELKNYIKDYILHSNNFTEEEKTVISQP